MKIKNQYGTSPSNSNDANSNNSILNSTHIHESHSQFMAPSTSTQIWTRSAVRAAQQQKRNDSSLCNRHHSKNHSHTHILGKIVKPIPVRPISSSSSSSSTHSSQFNANSIQSNLGHLDKSINYDTTSTNSKNTGLHNFSLIAKYFASFPATRLAKSSQIFSETFHVNSPSCSVKSTPFLPFKKSTNKSTADDQVHSSIVLRSQTASNLTNTDNLCTNFRQMIKLNDPDMRSSPLNNILNSTNPVTQTHMRPEYGQSNSINLNSSQIFQAANEINEQNLLCSHEHNRLPLNQDSTNSHFSNDKDSACYMTYNDEDAKTRLGQITMETRSTRKFLIKHHPYLQQNQLSYVRNNFNSKSCIQRPSINLMKKLSSKKIDESVTNVDYTTNTINSSSNNRSGRSSRSNNSGFNEQHDHNLLKFTDTAPTFSSNLKQLQKPGPFCRDQSTIKRRQHKNLTTASALTTELNSCYKKPLQHTRSRTINKTKLITSESNNYKYSSTVLCESDYYILNENSSEQYNDEQEEDSSGYYSSYQSVDLISSSGGSCVGAHSIANMKPKQNWEPNKITERHNSISSDLNKMITSSNSSYNQQKDLIPQHHYHTRYLTHCLEQKQTYLDQNHNKHNEIISMSHTTINKQNILTMSYDLANVSSTTTIPTTRLRYQQQLAAQAKYSSNHSECDLDLDQIEND